MAVIQAGRPDGPGGRKEPKMDFFVRERLSKERMAALLAEADRERLARLSRAQRSESRPRRLRRPLLLRYHSVIPRNDAQFSHLNDGRFGIADDGATRARP
jgi:hypothetical protein